MDGKSFQADLEWIVISSRFGRDFQADRDKHLNLNHQLHERSEVDGGDGLPTPLLLLLSFLLGRLAMQIVILILRCGQNIFSTMTKYYQFNFLPLKAALDDLPTAEK